MINKKKIIIFTDWFYPGYKAGGPITSIKNIVDLLHLEFEIYVFTSDRDLGDQNSYENIEVNKWINNLNVNCFYCSPDNYSKKLIKEQILEINPSTIYINGAFSKRFSIVPLLVANTINNIKIIVAPRGMFNNGALSIKPLKKKIFLWLSKKNNFYKNVIWHSTSNDETEQIKKIISKTVVINEIKNIKSINDSQRALSKGDDLKLFTVGRVSPVKNILFLLEVLSELKVFERKVSFDIYGPIEDESYFSQCKVILEKINTIKVSFKGEINQYNIAQIQPNYDLFITSTLNENFGHSIIEALSAQIPVIISDQTPWNNLVEYNCGYVLPLNKTKWINCLNEVLKLTKDDLFQMGANSNKYLSNHFNLKEDKEKYINLFS